MSLSKLIYGGKKCASCPAFGDWAIKKKLNRDKRKGVVGDIVLFDFNHNGTSDHIGIIIGTNSSGYITIEGNTSSGAKGSQDNGGMVCKRTRSFSVLNYVVHVPYETEQQRKQVVAKAKSQLGYKESPRNSNKTKYGAWYGVNGVPWCCQFVCWVFAHADEKEPLKKGTKGADVKTLQKNLNTLINANLTVDGDFGTKTESAVKAYQKKYGLTVDGIVGTKTAASIEANLKKKDSSVETPPATVAKATNAELIAKKALELAWADGTASSKYKYKGGSATSAFKIALAKVCPERTKWGAAPRVGASCDVAVCVIVRAVGIDKSFARGLGNEKQGQWHDFADKKKWEDVTKKSRKEGDIIIYKTKSGGHVCIVVNSKGKLKIAEASYRKNYLHISDSIKARTGTSGKVKLKIYRAK